MLKLGILGSTRGTNLAAIVNAIKEKRLTANIQIVISNKADAGILQQAQKFGLPHIHLSPIGKSREEYDYEVTEQLRAHQVDLIILIGYMRILSAEFIQTWRHKVINVHPSLLPAFAGMMDMDVHRAVIAAKHQQTGCTVHYVTEEVDAGPILLQRQCEVKQSDQPEDVKVSVQALEGLALVEAIDLHLKAAFGISDSIL